MTSFFTRFLRGESSEADIDGEIERWHASSAMVPLHAHLGMTRAEYSAYLADARALARMRDARIRDARMRSGTMRRIGDFDAVLVDDGEPNARANHERLRAIWPRPPILVRSRGDTEEAVAEACRIARTARVVVLRGDTAIRPGVTELTIDEADRADTIFLFGTRCLVNGIEGGAMGVRVWPKALLASYPTHGTETARAIDPCLVFRCWQMAEVVSDTDPGDAVTAFAMGYREAAKITFVGGRPLSRLVDAVNAIPTSAQSRLLIWLSVGGDHPHGSWAVLGARTAMIDLYSPGGDHEAAMHALCERDAMEAAWSIATASAGTNPLAACGALSRPVADLTGLPTCLLDTGESAWFKRTYLNPVRQGFVDITRPMLPIAPVAATPEDG